MTSEKRESSEAEQLTGHTEWPALLCEVLFEIPQCTADGILKYTTVKHFVQEVRKMTNQHIG